MSNLIVKIEGKKVDVLELMRENKSLKEQISSIAESKKILLYNTDRKLPIFQEQESVKERKKRNKRLIQQLREMEEDCEYINNASLNLFNEFHKLSPADQNEAIDYIRYLETREKHKL